MELTSSQKLEALRLLRDLNLDILSAKTPLKDSYGVSPDNRVFVAAAEKLIERIETIFANG